MDTTVQIEQCIKRSIQLVKQYYEILTKKVIANELD